MHPKKPLKGILIDPYTRTINEVTHYGELADYYRLLDCTMIEASHCFEGRDSQFIYIDEEGLFNQTHGFTIGGYKFMGRAIVMTAGTSGNTQSAKITAAGVARYITGWIGDIDNIDDIAAAAVEDEILHSNPLFGSFGA